MTNAVKASFVEVYTTTSVRNIKFIRGFCFTVDKNIIEFMLEIAKNIIIGAITIPPKDVIILKKRKDIYFSFIKKEVKLDIDLISKRRMLIKHKKELSYLLNFYLKIIDQIPEDIVKD
jgi:hypothetical protein